MAVARSGLWAPGYINSNYEKKIFFQAPPATDPVVQWSVSVMAERHQHLTEPECNRPVRQNRLGIEPGPPETFPAQRGSCLISIIS